MIPLFPFAKFVPLGPTLSLLMYFHRRYDGTNCYKPICMPVNTHLTEAAMKNFLFGVALGLVWLFTGSLAYADSFAATLYGDGFSCPHNCDAHVVFREDYNSTKYASFPSSSRTQPTKCIAGNDCRICFGNADNTCMIALYRGPGPGALSCCRFHGRLLKKLPLSFQIQ